ncbi:MAG: hypothetical protein ACI4QM_03015 [Alphaproteobacteria bacterium]
MANQQIIQALESYTGEPDSLNAFTETAARELGPDWTQTIYAQMADISDSLKERLDHAFNYYAATTAWGEIQSYLAQKTPLDYQQTVERIPVLEHWLAFFGAAGEEAVTRLQDRLRAEGAAQHQNTMPLDDPFAAVNAYEAQSATASSPAAEAYNREPQGAAEASLQRDIPAQIPETQADAAVDDEDLRRRINDIFSDADTSDTQDISVAQTDNLSPIVGAQPVEPVVSETSPAVTAAEISSTPVSSSASADTSAVSAPAETHSVTPSRPVFDAIAPAEPAQNQHPLEAETEQSWRVGKMFRQLDFISNVQAWISVRCFELGYTDFYTYRYYGFLVDVLDRTIEDLKELLADTSVYDVIMAHRPDGVAFLQNRLLAFEKESKEAHEGVLSDLSPLPREGLSVDDLKNRLGDMDLSGKKEYLGPAPDGFEMLEDPYDNMDDATLKKEYEKIEVEGNLQPAASDAGMTNPAHENMMAHIKNTSQTPQNGVQRKMSFSLGIKPVRKPGGTGGDAS